MIIGGIIVLKSIEVFLTNKVAGTATLYIGLWGLIIIVIVWFIYILLTLFAEMLRTLGRIEDQGLDQQIGIYETVKAGDNNKY
jgi:hypothetical protein